MSCVSLPGPIAARVAAISKTRGQTRRQVVVELLRRGLEADTSTPEGRVEEMAAALRAERDRVLEAARTDCNLATVGA